MAIIENKSISRRLTFQEYKSHFESLKKGYHFSRLGKTFATDNNCYLYDTGTGKVFQTSRVVHDVLTHLFETDDFTALKSLKMDEEDILTALEEIENYVETENILQAIPVTEMVGPHTHSLEKTIKNNLRQIILEVTERCNLRCSYCIYNDDHDDFRAFGQTDMSVETAHKAIDDLAHRSSDEESVFIGFYGGEPLLRFDLIKDCVDYASKVLKNKTVRFSMTSNLTLLTPEMAEYFASIDHFIVVCSIDGPEEIHNRHRKQASGEGSFELTAQGLKTLFKAYHDKPWAISFSMVINPPNYYEDFDKIQSFIKETEWIPDGVNFTLSHCQVSHPVSDYTGLNSTDEIEFYQDVEDHTDPLFVWDKHQINKEERFSESYVRKALLKIHDRALYHEPIKHYSLNGCCVPFARRTYITSKGDYTPCEKMGNSPVCGNVYDGLDLEKVKKHYVDDYITESVKYCADCWAINLCGQCYINCIDDQGINMGYRHNPCRYTRFSLYQDLIEYHSILEKDPQSLAYLNDIKSV